MKFSSAPYCFNLLLVVLLLLVVFPLHGQSGKEAAEAGEYDQAARLYHSEAKDSLKANRPLAAASLMIEEGWCWYWIDSLDLAQKAYAKADIIAHQYQTRRADTIRALAYHKMGVLYYYTDKYELASKYYENALELRRKYYEIGSLQRVNTMHNLALCKDLLDSTDEALSLYAQSVNENLMSKKPDNWYLGESYLRMGLLLGKVKNVQNGTAAVKAGLAIHRQELSEDPYFAKILYDAGTFFLDTENWIEGIALAQEAYDLALFYDDTNIKSQSANLLGACYYSQNRFELANKWYDLSYKIDLTNYENENVMGVNRYNAALSNEKLEKLIKALKSIDQAITHLESSNDTISHGDALYVRANILSKLNRPAEAESAYTEARCLVFPELPTDRLPLIQEIPAARHYFAANLFMDYGHHLLRHEQPDDALEAYELSWALLDSMRVDLKDDQSQRLIATKLEPTYAGALDALYQLYTRAGNDPALAERAFQLAERFRAAALLQALATRADRRSAEELDLRLRIAELERRTRETESDADLELSDELVRSRLKLEKLAAERPAAPQLPELDLPALQAYLAGRNETLLAYAFGRERGYVFRLDGNSLSWHPLGEREALAGQITRLRESLTASAYAEVSLRDPAEQGRLDTAYTNAAHGLYATWLAPALAGTAPEHLLILPAGELGYLPFGALLTAPAAPPVDYSALPYLDRGRQVRYGYSARTLTQPPAAHDHAPEHDRVLALAPGFPAGGTESTLLRGLREGGRLMRLAYSRPEVVEIASLLPTDTFFDGAANRACFLDRAPNYRVLHLSSHALVDERATDFSFIAFNQETDSLNRDELLYVNDLYALPLRADLAVLSACETGLGEAVAGEGVVSLARAFAYAGVGATVTTLWGVNDRATQHLVVDFYRRLAAREDKPAALAAATEKARAGGEYMHPFYWSGLVLYGRPEAVNLGGNNGWYWWLGGGLLLLSAGGWWWQRR